MCVFDDRSALGRPVNVTCISRWLVHRPLSGNDILVPVADHLVNEICLSASEVLGHHPESVTYLCLGDRKDDPVIVTGFHARPGNHLVISNERKDDRRCQLPAEDHHAIAIYSRSYSESVVPTVVLFFVYLSADHKDDTAREASCEAVVVLADQDPRTPGPLVPLESAVEVVTEVQAEHQAMLAPFALPVPVVV